MWSSTKAHSTKFVSAHHSLGIFTYLTSPDLIIVKILTFLMPTNALTSCLLLVSLLGGFVAAYVKVLPIVLVMEASTTLDLNAAKPLLEKVRNTLNPNTHCRGRPLFAAPQRRRIATLSSLRRKTATTRTSRNLFASSRQLLLSLPTCT